VKNILNKKQQVEIQVVDVDQVLVDLASKSELTNSELYDAARKGAVWLRRPPNTKHRRIRSIESNVVTGDYVALNYNKAVLSQVPLHVALVSDQVNFSVWNKPTGMMSQGTKWGDHCSVTEVVKQQCKKNTHLVHRLDKAASGLIVIAHTKNAVKALTTLFATRQVEKRYEVSVHGNFDLPVPYVINTKLNNKVALTTVQSSVYNKTNNISQLTVNISTGRKHQIRVHLSESGFPVVGDRLYSSRSNDESEEHESDLQLRAVKLAFECPFTHKPLSFSI